MTFYAKFPGSCVNCDDPIVVGQEIERTADWGYTHVVCPEDSTVDPYGYKSVPLPVCPRCQMVVSQDEARRGECDTCGVSV